MDALTRRSRLAKLRVKSEEEGDCSEIRNHEGRQWLKG